MPKKYRLMHKNIPVVELELDEASFTISAIGSIYNSNHIPVGIAVRKGIIGRASLNGWWRGRAIPASRTGIKDALFKMQIPDTQLLLESCMGLSLSDQYWICPAASDIKWEQVNFFHNRFSEDVGSILFGEKIMDRNINLMSPDNTSDGWLKKKWMIIDGKPCLIKGGSGATQQEPYNEVLASIIMERLGIPHVQYSLIIQDAYPYTVCEDFITPQTELISAWYIMQTKKKPNHVSIYQHYIDCCNTLDIPDIVTSVNQMLVLDYIIVNEDRHQNNFGVIRDAEALKYIGAAPIYDSGTSLWFDKPVGMIGTNTKLTCKPFKGSHEEQITLAASLEWLNMDKLLGIEEEWRELVRGSVFIDENRRDAICFALQKRIEMLRDKVCASGNSILVDTHTSDVKEDISYNGPKNADKNCTEHRL